MLTDAEYQRILDELNSLPGPPVDGATQTSTAQPETIQKWFDSCGNVWYWNKPGTTPEESPKLEKATPVKAAPAPRLIPNRCPYSSGGKKIPGAPLVPMSAETGERHPDLLERAKQTIRSFVCRQRAWPVCAPSNRNLSLDYRYGFDAELGDVLVGMLVCEECER